MTKDGLANTKSIRSHRKAYFILGAMLTAAMAAFPVMLSVQAEGPSSRAAAPALLEACTPASFTNATTIAVSAGASNNGNPYPSSINVSGLLGNIVTSPGGVEVTLNGFSHSYPDDVGIVLVGPTGAAFLLQDGAGAEPDVVNVTYKLSDVGASSLPNAEAWGPGTYKPTSWYAPGQTSFPAPGPGLNHQAPAPAGTATFASMFGGTAPNGTWSLFVRDFGEGDGGQITGGWTITITSDGCSGGSPNPSPSVSPSVSPSPSPSTTPPPGGTVTYTGTNVGPIPDGVAPSGTCGPPLNVQFAVSGVTGPISDVRVGFTGTHTWVGDLDVLLIAPGNAATQDIFTLTGGDGADSSNLDGTYNYFDTATNNWWAAASAVGDTSAIPPGDYRASNGTGQNVPLDPVFANLGNPNGTWILRFNDCVTQDTGTITAATLRITGSTGSPTATPTPTPTVTPTPTPSPSPSPVPSALDVNGRVMGSDGRGIRGALVTITGPGNFQRSTLTSSFGYYQFDSVPTGITYTITVSGKRYTFTPRNVPLTNVGAAQQNFVGSPVPGEAP